ncbi:LOW QUALITY PROTEIN: surface-associated interspersed protein (SURFIN) [Plasmodium relictum]|uniref:Surface-associated interspersed protein (SURFIN) n=1 Tax=Plasmodium relictum TaxID=85471 RepID=A0A1J1GMV3_PLARL|nr:LOW QUALITY PROTEIN: surface-associated interspersed protein (SURFIN) [Plasmodium relictum]CRG84547.1 surface-associated interspersed protein (SURFIN) [Plasmodium relictum]
MNTERKINRRKTRSASQYGAGYDRWKSQVTNEFDNKLQNISRERNKTKKRKQCRDFNGNVDDTKEDFMGVKVIKLQVDGDPEELWKEIEQHINTKIRQYPNLQCIRIPSTYPKEKRDKRNKIIDFCEERDEHFQVLKLKGTNEECLNYNKWINEEKDRFIKNNSWSTNDSNGKDQDFKISHNCTLINMGMFSNESCDKYNQIQKKMTSNSSKQSSFSPLASPQIPNRNVTSIKTIAHNTALNTTTTSAHIVNASTDTYTIISSTIPTIASTTAPTTTSKNESTSTTALTTTSMPTPTPSTARETTPISAKVPSTTSTNVPKAKNTPSPSSTLKSTNTTASLSTLKPTTTSKPSIRSKPVTTSKHTNTTKHTITSIPSTTLSNRKQNSSVVLTNFTTTTSVHGLSASIPVNNTSYMNMPSGISIKSSSTVTKSTIIPLSAALGSFLGIFLLFIFLYRCSFVGSWLGNSRSKKKKTERKKKQVQIDNESIFVGFSDKESEINMKNFPICNEKNSSTCEIALENENNERNMETKSNIAERRKKLKWKAVIEVHMIVLEEFQKEEWELIRKEFLKICLEEFKEEGIYSDIINKHLIMEADQEKITNIFLEQKPLWKIWTERNNKLIEKWKREQWFKNLKKEWKNEVNKYIPLIKNEEMMETKEKGAVNTILDTQKIIWKKWIQKQNKLHTFDDEELLKKLLVEYETEEEMKKNMEIIDREKIEREIEKKNKIDNNSIKNKLISRLRIEIHMMILDECKKEEWIRNKKEFFKTCIGELKLQDNSNEKELLEIEEEIMKNITLKKKNEKLEKFKKEKCFIELKQEWINNEKKYMEEVNKENLLGVNEEIIENLMLQKQKIIWKKHWEEICKKLEDENKKECFIKLMEELKKKETNVKEIDKINKEEKNIKEDEIKKEKKKKKMKHMEGKIEEVKKKSNYMTLRRKPKRKTIIEIHMMIMQDCKKEEWELNRIEFLEICLNEWLKNEEIIENIMDKEVILGEEKESSNAALENQKMLSKKWIERKRRLLEKWEKEEWFKNLKEEWKKEENMYAETKDKLEVMDIQDKMESNTTLERKKEIWKKWLQRQREVFIGYYKEGWFTELLEEYEKEEYEFIKEENEENVEEKKNNLENEIKEVAVVDIKKERLIYSMCAEIHMMVLDQCKKEEIESMKNEFLKSYIEQKKEHEKFREQETGNKKIDEIEKEREMNIMIENKKEKWECWKKEDWFQELKLNWKKEMIHMKEITDNIREKVINSMLETQIIEKQWQERQRNILKKRNKQNKNEMLMKKNKDEEAIEGENDENDLKELDITIL